MNTKRPSFIKQVQTCQNCLHELLERAKADESTFTWRIEDAFRNINAVLSTYNEVLQRDLVEDDHYIPTVVKGNSNVKKS